MDNTPMLDMERWVRFRWRLHPAIAVADTKYGTIANIAGLEQDGICAFIPALEIERPECVKHLRQLATENY
jgi:hypothetical protein